MRPRRIMTCPLWPRPGSGPDHGRFGHLFGRLRDPCAAWLRHAGTSGVCPRGWPKGTAAASRFPVHDGVGEGLELVAAHVPVEAGAGASCVVERELAGRLQRAGLGDADQGTVERPTGERAAHALVLA